MAKLGYLRVSTQEQNPDRQIDGLEALCDEIFVERSSAVAKRRPVYETLTAKLQSGDSMVIWSLDRAYRSTVDAILEVEKLKDRNVTLEILDLKIDTSTPPGMFVFSIIAAFAEMERRTLSQRTREGIAAAKKRGKRLGRPPALTPAQLKDAANRIENKGHKVKDVAASFGIAPWSLTRAIRRLDTLK